MTNHAAVLTALADPTRRAIFERLAESPSAVGELARDLPVSRPAVSQHLKVLKSAGLVIDQPAGTRRVYSVDPAGVGAIRDYFEQFWRQALIRFSAAATQAGPTEADQEEEQ
jgi:DNA-binding transcriptional ArsR family regulator